MNSVQNILRALPRLIVASVLALAAVLPLSAASAAEDVKLESSMGVANVTAGDTDYKGSVGASHNQVVKLRVYYHNQEASDSNKVAKTVRLKVSLPLTPGKEQVVKSSIKGDNTNTVDTQTTVNLDSEDLYLQYIPGSAVWKHATGSGDKLKVAETSISDDVVSGAQGAELGDEKPSYDYSASVTVLARVSKPGVKLVKQSEVKGQTGKWSDFNTAKPGETLRYLITYQNISEQEQKSVAIRDSLPPKVTLVPGTTYVANATHPKGVKVGDDITKGGIVIGNYGPDANAYITFEAKIPAAGQLACGDNEFRNVGIANAEGLNEYYTTAITVVKRACAEAPKATTPAPAAPTKPSPKPTYTCDMLEVKKLDKREVQATAKYTAKDGASFKSVTYDFGDGSDELKSDEATAKHTYEKDGSYNVTATVHFTVGGKEQTATSKNCTKSIAVATPAPTKPTAPTSGTTQPKEDMPDTGPGETAMLFVVSSIIGAIGYHFVLSRRFASGR